AQRRAFPAGHRDDELRVRVHRYPPYHEGRGREPTVPEASPEDATVVALRDAVQEAASSRAWSTGVQLAREDRVVGKSASATELVCEVRVPTRPVPHTVVLYPKD